MLTSRGWWFLLTALVVVGVAAIVPPRGHTTLVLIGLTLLLWFLGQWLLFLVRVRWVVPALHLEREVRDERGSVDCLWVGRSFEVRTRLLLSSVMHLPYVLARDLVPFGGEAGAGNVTYEGEVRGSEPVELSYRLFCPAVGRLRFEGLRVEIADLQGFFYHAAFVPDGRTYRVRPMLVDAEGRGPTTKYHNLLPPPGVHRLRRPGAGSELLDLRDYLPGDPPKMIAWKVSARRDRLITKEFESEVPVRCTLFVDASNSVRLGAIGQNALAREVEIAAAVAQATVAARDLVGLCVFDEASAVSVRPARTRQHLADVLNRLADAACRFPTEGRASVEELLPAAVAFAEEVYPHLLRPAINSFPFWLPLWDAQPVATTRHRRWTDYLYRLPAWLLSVYLAGSALIALGASAYAFTDDVFLWVQLGILHQVVCGVLAAGVVPAWWLLFARRRRLARWRKQLAALLSARYALAPTGLGLLLEDDERFSTYLQRFLSEHHVPFTLPLFDRSGRYLFSAPAKVETLARQLTRAVSQSHDNELFVLLADLLEIPEHLGPLFRAMKVAQARHHQVLVVCPWPPGIVPPGRPRDQCSQLPLGLPAEQAVPLDQLLREATTLRFHEAFQRLRRSLARIGVPVLCAQGDDPAPLIVERLDRLRTVRYRPGW